MQVIKTIAELRQQRASLPGPVGLVPTMGYLHDGHLSLVQAAREDNASVIVTIFVNPAQFSPDDDLEDYPRDLDRDLALLQAADVDLVFVPTPDLIYPPGYQTYVQVEAVSQGLEGAQRPGHFRGVATVVTKLFNLTMPDRAYFGQKDAQQAAVIKRLVRDLNMNLDVVICPVVREPDGLAMSSRNIYLQPHERAAAAVLHRALTAAGERYAAGERDPDVLRDVARDVLAAEPLAQPDYVSLADAATLQECHKATDAPLLMSLAAQVGKPRLLDNCLLPLHLNNRADASHALGG